MIGCHFRKLHRSCIRIMQPRLGQSVIIEIVRRRQELFGTIVQRLNLKHELHHTVPKLCILGFESLS